jgi:ABC-type uncharacterized transport system substrate-binding protein
MRAACLLLATLAGWVLCAPAHAHPHVWIDNRIAFVFQGETVTGLRLTWRFDEFFSDGLIRDFDADADGSFAPEEVAELEANAFSALKDYHYLSRVWVGGTPFDPQEVSDFAAHQDSGIVVYSFVVPLPEPVDPRATPIAAEVYDEEYYIEVLLAETDPVSLEGYAGSDCSTDVQEDADNAYYFDMVYPQQVSLRCEPQ